ncbi:hypothetical protein JFV28_20560 [Pseudomonas sp. TH05]|uniref:LPO_1073/Vpar_1526 family protein n=1 Tax=unclassified Pseudomonas TaxID=196821 RepID=UPI001911E520|nr:MULTISPECIES: LPO_1073/Vpar_1526 family protein [unclassified Pseudomonas]MBK5541483.1 hypothetical protein [Pseudomonas sp. TH07]MBK5558238.1 hypothetical protein [Pseudomonas sp. TH05]
MLGGKQDQTVGNGAIAVQATGNVSVGMSFTEVRELCQLFLENNFPSLRAEAKAVAEDHVRQFSAKLEQRIIDAATQIDPTKFRDPDVQACLNDAVIAAARRGEAANPDVLCTLVTERISAQNNHFKDIVLSEAVLVVPKLTAQHISLLCLTFFIQSVTFTKITCLADLDVGAQRVKSLVESCEGLSLSQKLHVQYTGACSYLNISTGDLYEEIWKNFKRFGHIDKNSFEIELRAGAPIYTEIIELYRQNQLWCITLTSVGQAIALASLSTRLDVDFSIWLR